jgi:hypothetical protein
VTRLSLSNIATVKIDAYGETDEWEDHSWITEGDAASWPDPLPADDLDFPDAEWSQ